MVAKHNDMLSFYISFRAMRDDQILGLVRWEICMVHVITLHNVEQSPTTTFVIIHDLLLHSFTHQLM